MELSQLITAVRDLLDDHGTPPLYPNDELTRYLNNAVHEVALRARLLQDDSGPACSVTLVAGQARYDLAPEVLVVRAVHVPGRSLPLIRTTAARLDRVEPGWLHEDKPLGVPKYAIFDVAQKTLTLYPVPADAGTARLRVWRSPDENELMEADDDEPVLILPSPEQLKHWAVHEAYLKKDGELYDPERAAQHEGIFTSVFGARPSVHELTLWSTQPTSDGPRRMQPDF